MPHPTSGIRESLQLRIAGLGIELTWEDAQMAEGATWKFYRQFISNGRVDVRLEVRCGELPRLRPESRIFNAAENYWQLSRVDGRFLFEVFDPKPPHPKVQVASVTPDFRAGEVYRVPEKAAPSPTWSLPRLMRPFGELLLINLLSQGQGLLVHGLAVSDRGEGMLFIGHSGAGKSTLAKLYEPHHDVSVLGDERVILTRDGGQFWLSGTPWPGTAYMVSAETVPLRRVFVLEHGTRNELIPERLINLSGLFFQQLFLPFWNGEAVAFALGLAEEVLGTLPSHRLRFVNDARVIEFLRRQG